MLDLQNQAAYAIEMKVFVLEPACKVQWKWPSDAALVNSFHHFRVVKNLSLEGFSILQFRVVFAAEILLVLSPPQCQAK